MTPRHRSVARRRVTDIVVKVVAWIGASIGIAALALILYMVVQRGIGAINWRFFTQLPPSPGGGGGGLGNAILGTLLVTFVAALMGIPLGFLAAIYLAEFGRDGRIATAIRLVANVMMGVPSIVVGVFIYGLLVVPLHHYSGFAGSAALAFIMLPVMARTAEDILNLVPNELRESALALGAPRWKATLGVVCRAARAGTAHRRHPGRGARRRRDGAAAVHGPQQPVLAGGRVRPVGLLRRSHGQPDRDDLQLRPVAVPELDQPCLGRRPAHHHRRAGDEHPRARALPAR